MTDIKVLLLNMLKEGWGLDFIPKFSSDWYEAKSRTPQVVVSQVITRPRFIAFSEDVSQNERRFEATYAIDAWSQGDQLRRQKMVDEVDRIIHSRCSDPGGDLEFVEVSSWRDLDEGDAHPRLYRSRVSVEVTYYV